MRKFLRTVVIPFAGIFLLTLALTTRANAQGPSVTTDSTDYLPGSTVSITGSGFQPNEIITLQVLHSDNNGDNDTSAAHQPWVLQADNSGNFSSTWVIPSDQDEIGALLLLASGQLSAQAEVTFTVKAVPIPTITTDQPEYSPRSTATFTGSGFAPFEDVVLKVKNLDRPCNTVSDDSSYLPWTVQADATGSFVTTWTVCDCAGDSLRLKATGQTSGSIAYAYFADAISLTKIVNLSPSSGPCGQSITVSATLQNLLTSVSAGAGHTITFTLGNNTATGVTNATGVATATITVPSSPLATQLLANFAGDGTGVNAFIASNATSTFTTTGVTTLSVSIAVTSGVNPTCSGSSVTFTATPTNGVGTLSYQWKKGAANVGTNSPTYTDAGTTGGSITCVITSDQSCTTIGTSNAITLTVNTAATVSAGGDKGICAGSTVAMTGTRGGSATSTTWTTSGSGTFSNAASLTAVYTPSANDITAGSVVLTITTNDPTGPCGPVSDQMTLTISAPPTTALAGADQSICGTSTTLAANPLSVGTGAAWSVVSGTGGSFGDGTDPTSTFTGNSSNNGTTYTLKWSLTNGGCTSSDNVNVVFFSPPTVSAGADKATCAGSTATMAGTRGGSATSATWTTSGNGTFSNATSNTAVYTPSANDIAAGSVTLTYTTNDPTGPCGPVSDQMTLTINPAPTTAVAGADQSICASSTSLAANSPTSGAGSWSIISGNGGVLDDASSPTSTFSGVQGNSYILRWTISNGGCTSSTDDVSITLKAAPSSVSALPVTATICNGDGLNLTASATGVQTITSGSDEFNGTLNYVVSGGTPTGAAAIFTQRASGYNPLLTGGTPFTTFDGGNFMSVGSIALIGNSQVTSALTSPVINTNNYTSLTFSYRHVYLKGSEANVNVQASTDGGTTWANIKTYSASVGTPANFAVESFTLPATYLNQSNLKIKFNYVGGTCNCNAWWAIDNVVLNGTPVPLFSWTSDNSGADGLPAGSDAFSSTNASITVHPTSSTTYTLAAESGLTSCPASTTATSTVTVNQKSGDPTEATASTNPICSGGSADLTLNGGGGGTGEVIRWYTDALCTQLLPGQSGSGNGFTVIPTTTTTYWGRYEDPAPCNYNSPAQSVTLAVNTAPAITMQPTNQTTTYGTPASFSVVATGTPAPTYQWEVNVGDGSGFFPIDDATSATFSIDQPTVDLSGFLFHVIVTNSCSTVVSDDVSLTVNPLAITITADAQSKTYGDVDPELTAQVTTGTIVNGDEPSGSLARDEGEDVGSYVINQGTYTYGSNYSETYVPANLTIDTLAVSVTADAQSKTYGDVDPALTYVSSPAVGTVLANGQTISFTGSLIRDAGETVVGSPYAINQGSVDNSNYAITYTGANLTINKLAVSVTADAKSKTYGDVDPALTYVSSPAVGTVLANGQTISFTGSLIRDAGETVVGSPYAINQGSVDNSNYAITYTGANLTINTLAVSVTADAQSKTYGDVDPALTYVSSPAVGTVLANGQTISFTGSLIRDAGETVVGSPYAINQGSVDNSNYAITYTGANLTINALAVSVTADAQSKTYGDVDPALTYVSSPAVGTVLANGQTISFTGSLIRDAGETVVGSPYAINQGSVDNSNYAITYTGANLTINALAVSVTADAQSKTYGDVDPALTYVSSPAVGTVLANGQTISFTGSLIRDAGETVVGSPYAINQGSVDNSNYAITYTGANLTINALAVSVTADAQSKTYGDVDPALTYVSSPAVGTVLANGQTISFTGSLIRDAGETVVGSPYAINQGSVDNSNYAITYTGANLTINALAVSVTADAQSKTYGDVDPALTYVSSPAVGTVLANGQTISFAGSLIRDAGETVVGSPYAINQGSVDNSNYAITYTGANLTINKLAVSVTADAKSKTYGDVDPALTYVSSPAVGTVLADGQTIGFTGSLTRVAGENVGSYAINQGTVNNSNYTITYTGANLTITPLSVTVTAAAKSKTYGNVDPALTYVTSPAVGTVLANGQTIGFTGSLTRVAGENVGSYAINQGTVNNSNYTITYTGANLTITPLSVTVTATAKTKVYGDSDPAFTFTSSPVTGSALPNGITISFTGSLTRVAGETVAGSPYQIQQGSINNPNYNISYVPANLIITLRPVTITADAKSKVYGTIDPPLTYHITTGSLAFTDGFTGSLTRVAGENPGTYKINQGTVSLNSNYKLTYVSALLTITKASVTPAVTITSGTQQYSDLETFTVTIPGGAPSVPGASNAAQSATFKVGTQEMGTASFTVSGTDLVATLTTPLIEAGCSVKGQMAPGTKTVTAVINKPNANYTLGTVQTTTLTITKENATVTYAGLSYFPTSCSTATIALSAIISDYNDGYPGDISNAKVTFHKGSTTGPVLGTASVCVVPLNILKPTSGVAATIFTYTLSAADLTNKGVTFDVYAVVDNYYTGDNNGSPGVITIATRGTDVVAGGGSLSITNSSGTYAGTSGTKTNFGYTAKYAKNGASTTGQVDIVFYSNNKTYQIKSTAISSITVSGQTANFSSKATLTDITNSTSPISIASNLDLLVDMNDVCISGLSDEVSFQLKNGSAVLFSSNWVSSKTTRKVISCGNIEVKNGSICSSGASYVSAVTLPEPASFSVSVLNNPSEGTSEFTLMVKGGDANKKVEMRVVNMAGQQVYETEGATNQTYRFGSQFASGMYLVQVIQGKQLKSLKVIKGKG